MLIFYEVDGKTIKGIYIGKTVDAQLRCKGHHAACVNKTKTGHVYARGRNSNRPNFRMIPLLDLSNEDISTRSELMRVAENLFTMLHRSLSAVLLEGPVIENYVADVETARLFRKISDTVYEKTGWVPICQRSDCTRLNWVTPLSEMADRASTWYCTTVKTSQNFDIKVYSGPELTTYRANESGRIKVNIISGGGDRRGMVSITGTSAVLPPSGTKVHTFVEIYPEGQRHPIPAFGVPEPGPIDGWSICNRIGEYKIQVWLHNTNVEGIRIEWQDDNLDWWYCWQQRGRPFELWNAHSAQVKEEGAKPVTPAQEKFMPHLTNVYVAAKRLYDALENLTYSNNALLPPGIGDGPALIIKDLVYEHLKQEISYKVRKPTRFAPPQLISLTDNEAWIRDNFAELGSDTFFLGEKPLAVPPVSRIDLGDVKSSCSMCTSANQSTYPVPLAASYHNRPCARTTEGILQAMFHLQTLLHLALAYAV